jgi:hypothetical protein
MGDIMNSKFWPLCICAWMCAGALVLIDASTSLAVTKCSEIQGAGSSLQMVAQMEVWAPLWTADHGPPECATTTTVKYRASSSGRGKQQWGDQSQTLEYETEAEKNQVEKFPAFIGSDTAASKGQEEGMEVAGGGGITGTLKNEIVSVPVAQSAVAVLIHTPLGCEPQSTKVVPAMAGSLLAEEYENDVQTFETLTGVRLVGASCGSPEPKLFVSSASSGTTAVFKRFLGCMSEPAGTAECANASEKEPWKALNSTTPDSEDTTWPVSGDVQFGGASGSEQASKVYELPDSLGYADLATARTLFDTNSWLCAGNSTDKSCVVIAQVKGDDTAASPEAPNAESNCTGALYTNETSITARTLANYGNLVRQANSRAAKQGTNAYPLCTITWDLAWHRYSVAKNESAGIKYTQEQTNSVKNYLTFIVGNGQSSPGLVSKHYGVLSDEIDNRARSALGETVKPLIEF